MANDRIWQRLLDRLISIEPCPVAQQGAFAFLWETFINIRFVPLIWGEQPGRYKCFMLAGSHKIYNRAFIHACWRLYSRVVATWHLQHTWRVYIWDWICWISTKIQLYYFFLRLCVILSRGCSVDVQEENTVRVPYDVFLISWTQE